MTLANMRGGFLLHSGTGTGTGGLLLWRWGLLAWLFAVGVSGSSAAEMVCDAADGSCESMTTPMPEDNFEVIIQNDSEYRADIYWDDGRFGTFLATLEVGGQEGLNVFPEHELFVTRHGVRENLFVDDVPVKFSAKKPTRFRIPSSAAPSDNPCQDRYGICEAEARRGSCSTTPGWMIVHCCKACDPYIESSRLIDPKIRCSQEHLNMTGPVWKPGDLNKLFEEWATSQEYRKYTPQVWSSPDGNSYGLADGDTVPSGPWVMTFDTFFSADEAEALILGGADIGFDRSTDQGEVNAAGEMEKVVSTTRTSANAWCTEECERIPQVMAVTSRIEAVTHIPKSHFESFQILQYSPDQFYRSHHDSSGKNTCPSGHRILTFFLYLSDVEEGGETHFNSLNISVKPKRGRALVWPSVRNENPDKWDPRMFHEAKDVIKGTKYAANHWIHLQDYEIPNFWGCTGSFG